MTGLTGKATRRSKTAGVGQAAQSERRDTHGRLPGQIVSFDPGTQTASIRIMHMPIVNGEPISPPVLEGVPVSQPRGGGFAITTPIAAGDYVDLTFDDVDTSGFYESGGQSAPATGRLNSLSDATATIGRQPSGMALSGYDVSNIFIGTESGAHGLRISPGGQVAIDGAGEELFTILHELLNTLAGDSADTTRSSPSTRPLNGNPTYVALAGRINAMKLR